MEISRRNLIAGGVALATIGPVRALGDLGTGTADLALHYDRPANSWTEALPIGNGHLAAMVFGGAPEERLSLNEGTIWAGGPHCYDNPDALAALPEIRQLIFAGKFR